MRILITNDDGITAPGLSVAEDIAAEIGGPDAEIWVIAPETERSGVSHAISYTSPLRITEMGPRRYCIDGFPADCTLAGIHRILADSPPDLILSGVNRGHNVAEDTLYSGTVGGAMEGAFAGIRAIALSQFYRRGPDALDDLWASSRTLGAEAVRRVLAMPCPRGIFYNVNFPAVAPDAVKGMTVCPQGLRAEGTFDLVAHTAPNGREYQFYRHRTSNASAPDGTDARMLIEGWVTITPLGTDLTATALLDQARAALG
ncbi:MAG: 5'/3'-nucleotidase SurE [Pseudomonadota bacterium]